MSTVWWFSGADWGIGSTFRFRVPVSRAFARQQVLDFYRWYRLPKGSSLEAI